MEDYYTFVDNNGKFIIPDNDTMIFLREEHLSDSEYMDLYDVFFHVVRQKGYVTIFISHECDFLTDANHPPDDDPDYEEGLEEKIEKGLEIIKKHFVNEYVTWELMM
jgi:hypothetical protein